MIYRIATLRAFTALPWLSVSLYIFFFTILCIFLSSFSARLERHEVSRTQSETRTGLCAGRASPELGDPAVGMAGNWQVGGSVMLLSPRALKHSVRRGGAHWPASQAQHKLGVRGAWMESAPPVERFTSSLQPPPSRYQVPSPFFALLPSCPTMTQIISLLFLFSLLPGRPFEV